MPDYPQTKLAALSGCPTFGQALHSPHGRTTKWPRPVNRTARIGCDAVCVRVQRLGAGASVAAVLLGLHRRSRLLGYPPPAALTGEWFGSTAVLAPSVEALSCDGVPEIAREPGPPGAVGGGWMGYLGYPDGKGMLPTAAGGWSDCVLRLDLDLDLDLDGNWWFESLIG